MDTLRSSIRPELMRKTLWQGTFLAGIGALLIVTCGAFLPPPLMRTWGFFIFLAAIALITLGLLPYRRLKRLEENPYALFIDDQTNLRFCSKNKLLLTIPLDSIQSTTYLEKNDRYGIAIFLKNPPPKKIEVQPNVNLSRFSDPSCDLFLPYFSERTYLEGRRFCLLP